MGDVVSLSDRRRPPAANPFAEVVTFDLGRRPVPAEGPTQEERIALLEEEVCRLRETNFELLEVRCGLITEVRGGRIAQVTTAIIGGLDAKA